jgi:hypothetical protein
MLYGFREDRFRPLKPGVSSKLLKLLVAAFWIRQVSVEAELHCLVGEQWRSGYEKGIFEGHGLGDGFNDNF